ncbi:MAG: M23 family metallopeptidase [Acidobacteriota bacterium]|nr:M23 family metallopeptidase [Acidobacteriota bacterium]
MLSVIPRAEGFIRRREIIQKELKTSVMQKNNNRLFTFLLQNSIKTKNYFNRIEVSKELHSYAVGFILLFAVAFVGFAGFEKNTAFAKSQLSASNQTSSTIPNANNPKSEYKAISYDRPESDVDITYDTGGQESARGLSTAETEAAANSMEAQIQMIIRTGNQAFLPTIWAHFGKINNEFGYRRNPFGGGSYEFHPGLDIGGEKGDTVVAPANGIVLKAEWQGGYGNMIEIDHGNGLTTRYGHLSQFEVQAGSAVQRGQLIGLVGSTGRSTGAHLHFEVRLNNKPINPRRFLSSAPMELAALTTR